MVVADHVLVASEFHRRELFAALPAVLSDVPDEPQGHLLATVEERTSVLPVGVELAGLLAADRPAPDGGPPLIVWPHRWDHDKRPEALLRVLVALAGAGVPFRVAFAGANTRTDPQEFDAAFAALGDRVVHVGHLPRPEYEALLLRGDVVVSTAAHEFFGVATVETMAAGLVPLLPDRLAYPELVPEPFHDGGALPPLPLRPPARRARGPPGRPSPDRGAPRLDPALLVGGGRGPVRRRARGARRPLGTLTRRR